MKLHPLLCGSAFWFPYSHQHQQAFAEHPLGKEHFTGHCFPPPLTPNHYSLFPWQIKVHFSFLSLPAFDVNCFPQEYHTIRYLKKLVFNDKCSVQWNRKSNFLNADDLWQKNKSLLGFNIYNQGCFWIQMKSSFNS